MWLQPTITKEPTGKLFELERLDRHLLCDQDGLFAINFNSSWEPAVLKADLKREDCIGWYRNPDRGSQDSLGVIYEEEGENRTLRPDFLFFVRLTDGMIVVDLGDPHGDDLADAMPKLKR
jgi:type III restriction enzyme